MMGELSFALPRSVQRELADLLPLMLGLSFAFLLAALATMKFASVPIFLSLFFAVMSSLQMRLRNSSNELNTANIELGKLKASWKGPGLALGFLVASIVCAILAVIVWVGS